MAEREWIRRRAYDDGVDRWEVSEASPAPHLRAVVSRYADYLEHTTSFSARQELATTNGVLIFALGDELEIIGANKDRIRLRQGEGFAGGIADGTSISRGQGAQAGIHIFLPLNSLAAVLATPLAELTNQVATMRDLIGAPADELGERLAGTAKPEDRFQLLDSFLVTRFANAPDCDETIGWSMSRLLRARGPSSTDLADEIGWSRRHFARRFRDVTGFRPERFRRVGRFQRFVEILTGSPHDELAGLAADCGYTDQSHLARDVREFADLTPCELRGRLIPQGGGVRDDPVPTVQDVSHANA